MPINRERVRQQLQNFQFKDLFVEEMGWNSVSAKPMLIPVGGKANSDLAAELSALYNYRPIANLAGVTVFEVFPAVGKAHIIPESKLRRAIHERLETISLNNLIIFLDDDRERTQSVWYWVKRETSDMGGVKRLPREHFYFTGQPGDLFLSKLDSLVVDLDELRPDGTLPIVDAQRKLTSALDIERVTKRFYTEFSGLRLAFVERIEGIELEADRNWYASVLLNRLMFIYFLQKRGFIQNNTHYLEDNLTASYTRGVDRYYNEFLHALFFEGFAKPYEKRTPEARALIGDVRYLNGGLFIPHALEQKYSAIRISDAAFADLLALFGKYSWHLDDTPGAADNEINPDVLGYIFEKYINQKAFGAYYTRTEITGYLCERTIEAAILDKLKSYSTRTFETLGDALLHLDTALCRALLGEILPKLSVLDPACGSGAFIVAAMRTLLNIYGATIRRAAGFAQDTNLKAQLAVIQAHPSEAYYIRKRIITDNLYGVDVMPEAVEIAKLRLFLALVASVDSADKLEPLPNIDFNVMAGNSLVGLLNVDESRFNMINGKRGISTTDLKQGQFLPPEVEQVSFLGTLAASRYQQVLTEKNRLIRDYRTATSLTADLTALRANIDQHKREAYTILNTLLLEDFQALGIKYENAQTNGKAIKRPLADADIAVLTPFHWGYEFDEVMERGGFDAILTNPPWETLKPQAKEFFAEHSTLVTKNKMDIKEFEVEQEKLLQNPTIASAWLAYQSRFPVQSAYFRGAPQFKHQSATVNGKKTGSDINLYKLFTEQAYNLVRKGGLCGVVIPSGIYTDLGAKGLRELLFSETTVQGLFGFENRKMIFEGVDSRFKFVVLTFARGGHTEQFPAAFMRLNPKDLEAFPAPDSLCIEVGMVRRLSPDSLSITEFKSAIDVTIAEKMLQFPLLGENVPGKWKIKFTSEFHMTNDSRLFHKERQPGMLPLYEGKMIHQFTHQWGEGKYWLSETEARKALLGRTKDVGQRLDYQDYRLGFRDVAASTNERTMIMMMLPPNVFLSHPLPMAHVVNQGQADPLIELFVCAVMNSFVLDSAFRQRVTAHLTFFFINQMPIPRLCPGDLYFDALVSRTARLVCTTSEYDALAHMAGIGDHRAGVTDAAARAQLRAEIDGIAAHLYRLTEAEYVHILGTFPLVAAPVKAAALAAFGAVERGEIK